MSSLASIRELINQAEVAFSMIIDSKRVGPVINIEGIDYQALPSRFNSKAKIRAFLRRFWGVRLTNIQICNLRLLRINGRLSAPIGDLPPLPSRVVSLKIVKKTKCAVLVRAVLSGDISGNKTIFYALRRNAAGALVIFARSGRTGDPRYQPCTPIKITR